MPTEPKDFTAKTAAPETDGLGDRMKDYENAETMRRALPRVPTMVRLDGKAFHTFTRNLARPFCRDLHTLMVDVTLHLVRCSGAAVGYTQSDEISLVLAPPANEKTEPYLGGRIQKLVSILASEATAQFNLRLAQGWLANSPGPALFDCRVWAVPTAMEAVNCLIWRERDAVKNSINSAAQASFSHGVLQGLNSKQLQEKLFTERGINWNDYPADQKRGTYVQRRKVLRTYTVDEIMQLPPKHAARANPELLVERSHVVVVEMPILTTIVNQEDVIFRGAIPQKKVV